MQTLNPEDIEVTLAVRNDPEDGDEIIVDVRSKLVRELNLRDSYVCGWAFSMKQMGLAMRLKSCLESGKAFKGYTVNTDVNGQKYLHAETTEFFHGRHMNGSLKRLGF